MVHTMVCVLLSMLLLWHGSNACCCCDLAGLPLATSSMLRAASGMVCMGGQGGRNSYL
jgi:hypothetical protein